MKETSALAAWTIKLDTTGQTGQKSTTVVFLTKGPLDEPWMRRVAKDEKDTRTVFLEPEGPSFRPHVYSADGPQPLTTTDLETAFAAVVRQSPGLGTGEIHFLTPHGPQHVKPTSNDQPAFETKILSQEGLEAQTEAKNAAAINSLVRQLRSPLGVIPLVGAGMSAAIRFANPPDRFPQWAELLLNMAAVTTREADVRSFVGAGDYERAAQTLDEHRPGVLPQRIKDAFDRKVDRPQLERGALSYLPCLAKGPVITTNFDHVLEQVFEAAGQPFDTIIAGPQPDVIINAIHQNERALLKIHGDCRDRTFTVFTVEEYESAYGVASRGSQESPQSRASIGSMAWLMFTNRPLLCLGCSLEEDRTTQVLRALRQELPGLTHYAILAGHYSLYRWEEREKQLDQMGIRPLWFAPERFIQIESLLREVLEGSSTRQLSRIPPPLADANAPGAARLFATVCLSNPTAIMQRFRDMGALIGVRPAPDKPNHVLQLITRALLDGKLAFFLGAHSHLGNLPLGNEFYERLARKFNCPALIGDRAAVAAFIVSRYGTQALWQEVKAMLSPVPDGPSAVHRLLAALPGLLRTTKRLQAAPLWVFTTNYDILMEEALATVGERFHLLYYIGGTATEEEGLFVERSADGLVRIIERPENLRSLDPASNVIVKLNGGLVHDGGFPESVLIATSHFERLAARIPDALPFHLRAALREKSLLFLGHGLAEPDVHALIKYSAQQDRTVKSWAIQLPPSDPEWRRAWQERAEYWRGWGLQFVPSDLRLFLAALHQEWNKCLL
jgi:hypothetical protein